MSAPSRPLWSPPQPAVSRFPLAPDPTLLAWPGLTPLGRAALAWEHEENRPAQAGVAAVQAANAWSRALRVVYALLHQPELAPPAGGTWRLSLGWAGQWTLRVHALQPTSPRWLEPPPESATVRPVFASLVSHPLTQMTPEVCSVVACFVDRPAVLPPRGASAQALQAWWEQQEASAGEALAPLLAVLRAENIAASLPPARAPQGGARL